MLRDCVILINTEEGVLVDERKLILDTVIEALVQTAEVAWVIIQSPNSKQKRLVCSGMLVEIAGKHKTFSSGDAILNYMLSSE